LRGSRATRLPSRKVLEVTAISLVLALIVGSAILATGFDVKNVKLNTQNVWVLQKGTGANLASRFGRVNTEVNELTSFNAVADPSELLQSANASLLFAGANSKFVNISSVSPSDFTEDTEDAIALDSSAKSIDVGETVAALISADGKLLISEIAENGFLKPTEVPFPMGVERFDATAVTLTNRVKTYSASAKKVFEYDPISQAWNDSTDSVSGRSVGPFQMASIRDRWALLDQGANQLWVSGATDPVPTAADGQLQKSSSTGVAAFFSTPTALYSVNLETRKLEQLQDVPDALITTRPITFKGNIYSTWLSDSAGWFYAGGEKALKPLDFAAGKLDAAKLTGEGKDALTFQSNGETAVINDTYSGWAWNLPTGELIVGTQNWNSIVPPPKPCKVDCEQPEDSKTPKPPVAVADRFGVRAGELVTLPVLLNDSDPNRGNVITIVPETVRGLDSNFGEVKVTSEQQMLTVLISPNARGTKTFTYKITDGTGTQNSNAAKVTLTVIPNSKNNAPGWCTDIVPNCLQSWPEASVAQGSEISIPFLNGWVDPDGDRFFISKAEITKGEGNLAYTPAGDLVYQNENAGEKRSSTVTAQVTVSDIHGARSTTDFAITVRAEALFTFDAPVVVIAKGEPTTIDFAKYTSGAQGFISIANLAASNGDTLKFEQLDSTRVKFTAADTKPSQMIIKLRDGSGSEVDSLFRVNVVSPDQLVLSTAPVTVLVSPGLDTSIDVFSAAHNPANRALVVSKLQTDPNKGALLSVDKIKGGNLRIRGKNINDAPGFVGVISYTLSDGSGNAAYKTEGQAFVYELAAPEAKPAVARRDSVTIRAGQSTEVDVLANDLGSPGVPLVIDSRSLVQEEKTSCIKGGLIFAGGGKIRIVAPPTQGGFSCGYSIYAANNPLLKTLATITIKVVQNDEGNQPPVAHDLVARVRAGETVSIPVLTAGVDPDGDSVLVQSLLGVRGNKGAAYINPDGSSIEYTALSNASGQDRFTYTLVDSLGLVSGTATVKVAIIGGEPDTAPVTLNDYAEVLVGASNKVVMDPLSNDFDPQPNPDKPISLVKGSVTPDAPQKSENYRLWKAAIRENGNRVTIQAGTSPMTMRFIYTAQSSSGSRSSGYITVKATNDAIDDAPDITDTFATRAQATEFVRDGLDVVSKKVIWTSGDVNKLTLSLWKEESGFKVAENTRITASDFPKTQKIVIFKLSGTNFAGKTVSSYGFLHLPGTQPKITFDPSASKQKVDEGKTVSFDMAELTNLETGLQLGKVRAHGVRENASCSIKSGTTVSYSAGTGEPWSDFCDVEVKLANSDEPFITLLVPIEITPREPQPELTNQQITIVPGESSTQIYDLINMTIWYGKSDDDKSKLKFSFNGGSDLFKISKKSSSKLEIQAYGSSAPGSKRSIKISLDDYPNTKSANLVLVVGQLPNQLPVAPTLTLDCSVADGEANCAKSAAEMNATPGVYNPYENEEDLRFAPFGYTTGVISYESSSRACGKVTIKTLEDRLYAQWGGKPTGVKCTVPYNVLDKEGRLGSGTLEFSFAGIPGNVSSVSQVDYTASTVTLQIVPPASSFPAITEFEVVDGKGESTTCDIDSSGGVTRCVLYNLSPYDGVNKVNLHTYSVRARNDQGLSEKAKVVERVYSYKAPKRISQSNIDAVTVYDPEATESRGYAEVTVRPVNDSLIERYEITGDTGLNPEVKMPSATFDPFKVRVAAKPGKRSRITVTAFGRVDPPVRDVVDSNSTNWVGPIAAKPKIESVFATTKKSGSGYVATVGVNNLDRNWSFKSLEIVFGMYTGTTAPTCVWDVGTNAVTMQIGGGETVITNGRSIDLGDGDAQKASVTSGVLKPILDNTSYTPYVCLANGYGYTKLAGASVSTLADPIAGAFAYDISPTPNASGAWLVSLGRSETKAGVKPQFNSTETDAGWSDTISSDTFGAKPVIRVRYCLTSDPTTCSKGTRVLEPLTLSRSWQLKITGVDKLVDLTSKAEDPSISGETSACIRNHEIDFKLAGSGLLNANKKPLWQISGTPTYVSTTNTTGDLDKPGDNWRIPNRPPVKTISVQFSGNQLNSRVKGLTGTVTYKFTCTQ
jgi:hypothetical protein